MNVYRIVPKDANGFQKWKVGFEDGIIPTFHPDTVEEAIQSYLDRNCIDPLEFMVSLDDFRLITWEETGKLMSGWPVAVIRSIDKLG